MKDLLQRFGAFVLALAIAGCGGANVGAENAPSTPLTGRAALPLQMRPHGPWEFWIYNVDKTKTLHVVNTHRGQCVYMKEIPTTDIAPGQSWSGVVWSHGDGTCFFRDSVQVIELYFTKTADEFMEVEYSLAPGRSGWGASKLGGRGELNVQSGGIVPVRTRCYALNRVTHEVIVCGVTSK